MLFEVQQKGGGGGQRRVSGYSTSTQKRALFTLMENRIKILFMLYIETQHRCTLTQTNTPMQELTHK